MTTTTIAVLIGTGLVALIIYGLIQAVKQNNTANKELQKKVADEEKVAKADTSALLYAVAVAGITIVALYVLYKLYVATNG